MNKLKRNTYIQGAFIATLGIVISKILGMIYVIPFYSMIGEQGGALYGYAYNIYSIFLGISTAGIPLAISKIVSEYDTLGNQKAKEMTFSVAKKILSIIGIICFVVMMVFTEDIAYLIIGDISGGNTYQDIAYVIRVISVSILIVPLLSVYRGYLQGHRIMTPTSISQVLEQIIRVSIIIGGSFFAKYVFKLSLSQTVSIALLGATIGALISLVYLKIKVRTHKKELICEQKEDASSITAKSIAYKILLYSFPFIFSDVCKSLYNSVDTFFVVRTLVSSLGYTVTAAESIMSVISTWGNKLNMIVIALGTGFMSSLIPNLTASIVKNDKKDIQNKVNKTYQILIFATLPMAAGLSFLSQPVWNIFYGASEYGASVFAFSIFTAFITVLVTTSTTTLLTLKEYKTLFISLTTGLVINAVCDVPAMLLFDKIGIPAISKKLDIGVPTLRDIVSELQKPGRDLRDELPPPLMRSGDIMEISDLKEGMELMGTVRNVIDFGAFVDIGVHQDGLVHISQICNRYIKHPLEAVKVGEVVKVRVISVDVKKKRIGLTMRLDEKR